MIYCIEIWGMASDVHLNSLYKIQKKIVRIMKSVPTRTNSNSLFIELKILPIFSIYKYNVVLFMFKFTKGLLPEVFNKLFRRSSEVVTRTTRQRHNLYVPKCNTTLCQKFITMKGITEWNCIHKKIDHFCSIHSFKKKLKTKLLKELKSAPSQK